MTIPITSLQLAETHRSLIFGEGPPPHFPKAKGITWKKNFIAVVDAKKNLLAVRTLNIFQRFLRSLGLGYRNTRSSTVWNALKNAGLVDKEAKLLKKEFWKHFAAAIGKNSQSPATIKGIGAAVKEITYDFSGAGEGDDPDEVARFLEKKRSVWEVEGLVEDCVEKNRLRSVQALLASDNERVVAAFANVMKKILKVCGRKGYDEMALLLLLRGKTSCIPNALLEKIERLEFIYDGDVKLKEVLEKLPRVAEAVEKESVYSPQRKGGMARQLDQKKYEEGFEQLVKKYSVGGEGLNGEITDLITWLLMEKLEPSREMPLFLIKSLIEDWGGKPASKRELLVEEFCKIQRRTGLGIHEEILKSCPKDFATKVYRKVSWANVAPLPRRPSHPAGDADALLSKLGKDPRVWLPAFLADSGETERLLKQKDAHFLRRVEDERGAFREECCKRGAADMARLLCEAVPSFKEAFTFDKVMRKLPKNKKKWTTATVEICKLALENTCDTWDGTWDERVENNRKKRKRIR